MLFHFKNIMRLISTVISLENISKKTVIGRLKAFDVRFMIDLLEDVRISQICRGAGNQFIDTFKSTEWTKHIQPARDHSEINIELIPDYEEGNDVFMLQCSRDIPCNSTLKLWFSDYCVMQLRIPFLTTANIINAWLYRCHLCPFKTPFPNVLKSHLYLYNHITNTHQSYCDKIPNLQLTVLDEFPETENLKVNQTLTNTSLIKTTPKMHRCFFCGKMYSRKYGLKIHIRTHTGYKPLSCKICRRPFGDPSNLNKHTRLHSQASIDYKCDICNKNLLRRRDLERHYKTQHEH